MFESSVVTKPVSAVSLSSYNFYRCFVVFSRMAKLQLRFGMKERDLDSGMSLPPNSWTKLSLKKRLRGKKRLGSKKRLKKVLRLSEAPTSFAASRTLIMRPPRGLILNLLRTFLGNSIKTLPSSFVLVELKYNLYWLNFFECDVDHWPG